MHPKFPKNYDPLAVKNRYNVNTKILFIPNNEKQENELLLQIFSFYESGN